MPTIWIYPLELTEKFSELTSRHTAVAKLDTYLVESAYERALVEWGARLGSNLGDLCNEYANELQNVAWLMASSVNKGETAIR